MSSVRRNQRSWATRSTSCAEARRSASSRRASSARVSPSRRSTVCWRTRPPSSSVSTAKVLAPWGNSYSPALRVRALPRVMARSTKPTGLRITRASSSLRAMAMRPICGGISTTRGPTASPGAAVDTHHPWRPTNRRAIAAAIPSPSRRMLAGRWDGSARVITNHGRSIMISLYLAWTSGAKSTKRGLSFAVGSISGAFWYTAPLGRRRPTFPGGIPMLQRMLPVRHEWLTHEPGYGKLVIEPFEPGFALTVGTAYRRVLLSSIHGAVPTWAKIEGVLHEFSYLQGVNEDILDIILNLRKVVFALHVNRPKILRLKAQAPRTVTAGAFEPDADVDVLTPDVRPATLDKDGSLEVELRVERGRGYQAAERR